MPALLFAIVFLIVYGSLYPWEFRPAPASPLQVLLATTQLELDRFTLRDIAVNLALYIPLGAAGAGVFRRSRFCFLWPVLMGAGLSICIELAQVYTPARRPSLMDIASNIGGSALGVVAYGIFDLAVTAPHARSTILHRPDRSALLLLFIWIASLTFPLFPVLGRTALYEKFFIFRHAPFSWITVISFAVMWFAAGGLGSSVGPGRSCRLLFASILVLPAQLFIVQRQLLPAQLLGAVAGAAAFYWVAQQRNTGQWIAWTFSAVILIRGLAPFHFSHVAQSFSWIPFRASLETEWQQGTATLLDKTFWYTSAVWLVHRGGVGLRNATLLIAQLLAAIEIVQIWLPGRSPEITDPLLALAGGVVLWLLRAPSVQQTV